MVIHRLVCPLIKLHSGSKRNELTSIRNIEKQADKGMFLCFACFLLSYHYINFPTYSQVQ
ncbi:UNVERIFIED_CONTAM: hypothetical protein ABIC26_003695 [Paenibacillus sp. PvR008]